MLGLCPCVIFLFFKQKRAYDMRISDLSSDVFSSDLPQPQSRRYPAQHGRLDRSLTMAPAAPEAAVPHRAAITVCVMLATIMQALDTTIANVARSEERRVGKECVSTSRSLG